ncbi:VOC family protein [Clostridium algidicarnis]|uniref:VOC family protein n=1 Tax=Clostridium algidicarnis TaxID=37659 RepID=UPI001FECBC0B|nr:VOC family protein [Clostridium algidicarnis]
MLKNIAHVGLTVSNIEESIKFYKSELCFYVENIDETYETLKSKGVEFLSEP